MGIIISNPQSLKGILGERNKVKVESYRLGMFSTGY